MTRKKITMIIAILIMLFGLTAYKPGGRAPNRQPINPEGTTMTRFDPYITRPHDFPWRAVIDGDAGTRGRVATFQPRATDLPLAPETVNQTDRYRPAVDDALRVRPELEPYPVWEVEP